MTEPPVQSTFVWCHLARLTVVFLGSSPYPPSQMTILDRVDKLLGTRPWARLQPPRCGARQNAMLDAPQCCRAGGNQERRQLAMLPAKHTCMRTAFLIWVPLRHTHATAGVVMSPCAPSQPCPCWAPPLPPCTTVAVACCIAARHHCQSCMQLRQAKELRAPTTVKPVHVARASGPSGALAARGYEQSQCLPFPRLSHTCA